MNLEMYLLTCDVVNPCSSFFSAFQAINAFAKITAINLTHLLFPQISIYIFDNKNY